MDGAANADYRRAAALGKTIIEVLIEFLGKKIKRRDLIGILEDG